MTLQNRIPDNDVTIQSLVPPAGVRDPVVIVRGATVVSLSALPKLLEGHLLADLVTINASLDIVLGEIDR